MSNIEIKNLNVSYDEKEIFTNFNLAFEEGKINVILGPSGAGKTTLLNAIAGLIPYSGEVAGIDGGISYIFQKDRLIKSISIFKNLDLILKSEIKDKEERKKKIHEMLDLLEIRDLENAYPTSLSGGQLQRVSIARAFLYPSKILLLDEPFKALDTPLKARIIKTLISLNNIMPKTIIFVTHAIDECLLLAQKYFVFSSSPVKIVTEGKIDMPLEGRLLVSSDFEQIRKDLLNALFS